MDLSPFPNQCTHTSPKRILIYNFISACLWGHWNERNNRTFKTPTAYLWEDIMYMAISWRTKSNLFGNYDVSIIFFNWKVFL